MPCCPVMKFPSPIIRGRVGFRLTVHCKNVCLTKLDLLLFRRNTILCIVRNWYLGMMMCAMDSLLLLVSHGHSQSVS